MEPRSYPAALLPVAETCPGALDIYLRTPTPSVEERWREAFTLGGMEPTAYSLDAYRRAKLGLPDLLSIDVEAALEDYQADVRAGLIPSIHRFAVDVDADLEGRVPAVGRERIHTRIDCTWQVAPGADSMSGRTVVLQHELARFEPADVMGLDLAFAALAMATANGTHYVQMGRCFHAPSKPPVYRWSRTLDEVGMEALWERIGRIFRRRRETVRTELCESCGVRRRCPEWILPAVHVGRTEAYKFASGQDPAHGANDVSEIKRYVKALREAADVAEGHLRALRRDGAA